MKTIHKTHWAVLSLTQQPASSAKKCKSIFGLKRHMNIYNDVLLQPDPINPMRTVFVCDLATDPASQLLVYEVI